MERILIFGASGYLGQTIYKELQPYYDVYGTYCHNEAFHYNQRFCPFDFRTESPSHILKQLKPSLVISAVRGEFAEQILFHQILCEHASKKKNKLIFLSSANVFDAFTHYPSYEYDKTLSESIYGRLKIKIENEVMRLKHSQWAILRLPMVFGVNSPRNQEIKNAITDNNPIEIYPNSIINVTSGFQFSRQVHYIINRKLKGIFHLGSRDLIHHDEFLKLLVTQQFQVKPIWKRIYASNEDRYLALLHRDNPMPKHLQFTVQDILDDCTKI